MEGCSVSVLVFSSHVKRILSNLSQNAKALRLAYDTSCICARAHTCPVVCNAIHDDLIKKGMMEDAVGLRHKLTPPSWALGQLYTLKK